eukprot:1790610-Pleurochrysis_carterae.AAC.1
MLAAWISLVMPWVVPWTWVVPWIPVSVRRVGSGRRGRGSNRRFGRACGSMRWRCCGRCRHSAARGFGCVSRRRVEQATRESGRDGVRRASGVALWWRTIRRRLLGQSSGASLPTARAEAEGRVEHTPVNAREQGTLCESRKTKRESRRRLRKEYKSIRGQVCYMNYSRRSVQGIRTIQTKLICFCRPVCCYARNSRASMGAISERCA